jgi:hypothetical protein
LQHPTDECAFKVDDKNKKKMWQKTTLHNMKLAAEALILTGSEVAHPADSQGT